MDDNQQEAMDWVDTVIREALDRAEGIKVIGWQEVAGSQGYLVVEVGPVSNNECLLLSPVLVTIEIGIGS